MVQSKMRPKFFDYMPEEIEVNGTEQEIKQLLPEYV